MRVFLRTFAVLTALALTSAAALAQAEKKPVHSAADLPRFTYAVTSAPSDLLQADAATFAAFATPVGADVDAVLAGYDIQDRATLRDLLSEKLDLELLSGTQDAAALQTALQLLDGEFAYAEPLRLALQQITWGRPSPLQAPEQGSVALGISSITFAQLFAYAREAIARHGVTDKEAPLYINIYRLVFSLAWTIGPAVAAWVMVGYSFKGIFLICGAIFFVLFLIVWAFVPSLPPSAIALGPPVSLTKLLLRRDLLCYFSAFVLVFICTNMGIMNLPLMILKTLHGTQQQIGIAYSVAPVFELPFMALFGVLATQGEPAPLIRLGVIIAVAYYALLALVQAPWEVYPLQILSAAMVAIVSGLAITFFQAYIPNQPGTATNLYSNANRIGSSIGYLSFGTLSSLLGYRAVFVVCSLVCVGAFTLLWLAREQHAAGAAA